MGVSAPSISLTTRSIVPSPPNTSSASTARANAAALGNPSELSRASRHVTSSASATRPVCALSRAARCAVVAAAAPFPWLAISPILLICFSAFFKQCQKFLVAGRPEQRRFRLASPNEPRLLLRPLPQFRQHPLVHRRVADHSAPFVRLGFARFKLRLDQREDATAIPQQFNRRRKDFPQRNKRAIRHHQIRSRKGPRKTCPRQRPRVQPLHHHHPRILAQLPRQLAPSHIHRVNPPRAPLQQAIGEPAR